MFILLLLGIYKTFLSKMDPCKSRRYCPYNAIKTICLGCMLVITKHFDDWKLDLLCAHADVWVILSCNIIDIESWETIIIRDLNCIHFFEVIKCDSQDKMLECMDETVDYRVCNIMRHFFFHIPLSLSKITITEMNLFSCFIGWISSNLYPIS